ncbi:MAG TPA: antibiotic biosynthesis monooxygenase [Steroidobacter sp.]
MLTAIAVHHPKREHRDAFLAFCRTVRDGLAGEPGLIEFKVCGDPQGRYLAGVSTWESEEAFSAALTKIRSFAPLRDDDWSARPDDGFTLVEL